VFEYKKGDIFYSSCMTLVCPVNTVGVMGAGLAKAFALRFVGLEDSYKRVCRDGGFKPGELRLWKGEDKWVLLFPTKEHWRRPSKLQWVDTGLWKFRERYRAAAVTSVAFPMIGCGLGGLRRSDVVGLFEAHLKSPILKDIRIEVYL
jgi:O-acetyl-ADP-ribose deacetylase (regulator of RNase III)